MRLRWTVRLGSPARAGIDPGVRGRGYPPPRSLERALEVRVAGTRPGRAAPPRGRAEGAGDNGRGMRQVARVQGASKSVGSNGETVLRPKVEQAFGVGVWTFETSMSATLTPRILILPLQTEDDLAV